MNVKLCALILFLVFGYVKSARILGVFQIPSYSHQQAFQPIWKELSLRGHDVTIITPNPLKDPNLVNLTEIDTGYTKKILLGQGFQFFLLKDRSTRSKMDGIFQLNFEIAEAIFENEDFKKIYENPDEKFDLILVQVFMNPIFHSLGARFKAPVIGISSFGAYIGTHLSIGNPHHPALNSEMFDPQSGKLNYWERWYNALYYVWVKYFLHFKAYPRCNEMARRYLGSNIPNIANLEKNMSALFLSTVPVLYEPRPYIPTIVELGPLHINLPKPLLQDLKELLDVATEGVIYFSLGSNVQSINIPERFRNVLIETFRELPYMILWKWESDYLPEKPKNVVTRKWLPQQDVLAHKNVKVFITQCGLQSLGETFSRSVPIVGIPFIGDQERNIKRISQFGAGIAIDYLTVTKDELKRAIIDVAENKKYREKAIELNGLINDQPMKPLEKAMWWIEYILRHNGTKHLRSPTADISWCHFLFLDLILPPVLVLFCLLYVLKKLCQKKSNNCHQKKNN